MTKIIIILFLIISNISFGQTDVFGKWKSTNGLARQVYELDSLGYVKMEFYGDLMYYFIEGQYSKQTDTILISYNEPSDEQKKAFFRGNIPTLFDTLFVINKDQLQKKSCSFRLPLYKRDRNFIENINEEKGQISFSVNHFGDTIVLQQQRNYKWVNIEEWYESDKDLIGEYNFQLPLHSDINKYRFLVKHSSDETIKRFEIDSHKKKIKVKLSKKMELLEFSDSTYYTLYNSEGLLISEGINNKLENLKLTKGFYFLEFDNQWKKIKIKK